MCNEAARRITLGQLREDWSQTRIPLSFPEGLPNMAPLDGFKITDSTVIIRANAKGLGDGAELVTRRWSWPGAGGKPVYKFSLDAFYEFTAAEDPKVKRKIKWAFRLTGHEWFCIAGL